MNPGKLKHRVEVYGKVKVVNSRHETEHKFECIKKAWARIETVKGTVVKLEGGKKDVEVTHIVEMRTSSGADITKEMYLMCKNVRYDVLIPDQDLDGTGSVKLQCTMKAGE